MNYFLLSVEVEAELSTVGTITLDPMFMLIEAKHSSLSNDDIIQAFAQRFPDADYEVDRSEPTVSFFVGELRYIAGKFYRIHGLTAANDIYTSLLHIQKGGA